MNLQLANVISDISGLTGKAIVRWSRENAIPGSWPHSVIRGFRPAKSRLPKAWRAADARHCCLCCSRNW